MSCQLIFILLTLSKVVLSTLPISSHQNFSLLLVVGDVSFNSARILYEDISSIENEEQELKIFIYQKFPFNLTLIQQTVVQLDRRPKILEVKNLKSKTKYFISFGENTKEGTLKYGPVEERSVSFKTFGMKTSVLKFILLSCNRYIEDNETGMFSTITEIDNQRDGIFHLGDQIYSDLLVNDYSSNPSKYSNLELTEAFRNLYRKTWSQPVLKKILRESPNWMIPDDHDIITNIEPDLCSLEKWKVFCQIGRNVYYQYQHQLRENIDPCILSDNLKCTEDSYPSVYSFQRLGNVSFAFIDLRYEKAFHFDSKHPLFGKTQLKQIKEQVSAWGKDPSIQHILLFASIPFAHQTEWMTALAYQFEKEKLTTSSSNLPEIMDFIHFLEPYSSKVKLIGGDIHSFARTRICHFNDTCIPQLITSGITRGSASISSFHLYIFRLFAIQLSSNALPSNWRIVYDEVFLGNNYGVIELHTNSSQNWTWYGRFRKLDSKTTRIRQFVFDYAITYAFFIFVIFLLLIQIFWLKN